jgi:DNA polymerase I-like protein with 3'-5' exonuclease and polymerase domains
MAPPELCRKYATEDALRTATLYLTQIKEYDDDEANGGKLWQVLRRELKLMEVIRAMENRGVCVDEKQTLVVKQFYEDYITKSQKEINKLGGKGLNPKSPKQMCQKFFGELGLTPRHYSYRDDGTPVPCPHCKTPKLDENGESIREKKITKKGKVMMRKVTESPGCKLCQNTGYSPKCDAEFLYNIAGHWDEDADGKDVYVKDNPLAYWILNYDAAKHMMSSFIKPYLQLKTKDQDGNWILRPNYKQCGPITGRISCERPNMMNVASDTTGRKKADVPYRPRECFRPRPGHVLYLPDYSQIEVWVFAFLSGDTTMQAPLLNGEDFHGGIATRVWGHLWDAKIAKAAKKKKPEDLTDNERKHLDLFTKYRKRSKLLMFCKLYGGGAAKVAELLGCSVQEAQTFIEEYDARLPGVKIFMKKMIDLARRQGYVLNPFGRKYPIDRNFAYKATNYLVQGSSAELLKNAMVNVYELTQSDKYRGHVHLLLTIHDELVIEVEEAYNSPELMQDIIHAMQQDHKKVGCHIPFPVGMKVATECWAKTQEIESEAA